MPVLFSLRDVAQPERPAILESALASYRLPLRMSLKHHHDLRAQIEGVQMGSVEVEAFSINGATGSVSRGAANSDQRPEITLHLLSSGSVDLLQNGQRARPRSGDVVISSNRHSFITTQKIACEQYTLSFREEELAIPADRTRSLLATSIVSTDPVIRVISDHLRALAQSALTSPDRDWDALQESTKSLARALILHALGDERAVREPMAASLVDRVFDFIERNLADPELSATSIAGAHSISTRYLFTLFSRRDVTLAAWIRNQRVDRAAELLCSRPEMSIAEAAYRCGFADQSHFARTFKREKGESPRQWRREQLSAVLPEQVAESILKGSQFGPN